ncbi:MAG: hypothetical protein QOH35_2917, partial [Acidobacteriaceae bacterium]|nr:hypothetical protein [Acidobacteriaceae bacterium]
HSRDSENSPAPQIQSITRYRTNVLEMQFSHALFSPWKGRVMRKIARDDLHTHRIPFPSLA